MMPCCQKDGQVSWLRFMWRFCVALNLNRAADWYADKKREAILLRHPWMGKRAW